MMSRCSQTPGSRPAPTPSHQMAPLLSPKTARSPQATSHSHARSPSPNYFGFTAIDESYDSESARHARKNWSPPSSTVRSTAAFSPTVLPVDQNPEFDAFRRQSESMVFNLGSLHNYRQVSPTHNKSISDPKSMAPPPPPPPPPPSDNINNSNNNNNNNYLDPDSAFTARSPKRHLSNDSTTFAEAPRRQSPATFGLNNSSVFSRPSSQPRSSAPFELKLPPPHNSKPRAETLPAVGPLGDQSSFVTPQHFFNLLDSAAEEILILDLRVSTQYSAARIRGALNLCIPTTLLKRPSFNVNKLAETFKDSPEQRTKFGNWKSSKYIVVYDSSSSQLKDAISCVNTIKKFDSEGYDGTSYILKGGFAEFSKNFPSYVERPANSSSGSAPPSLSLDGPEIAPVIGGCPMPVTKNAANPFFGNIRQNMDLIGGVGQMPVKTPSAMSNYIRSRLPDWLRDASDEKDRGARVSEKFLQIEKREQKRMQDALSGQVSYGTPTKSLPNSAIQIAGIEKGSKNRYNNIWPFEHSRVKIQGIPSHGCDYFNASHITSSRSHKRYIATQGPIPTTFADFWNIVWQQDARVIVMLTAEKEGGQVKAHNYWSDKQYGPMRLEFLSEKRASLDPEKIKRHRQRPSMGARESTDGAPLARLDTATTDAAANNDQPFVIVRKLALSHEGFPFERMREITQLQYSSWPDFGAPAHPAHLLGLVEQCDAVVRKTTKHTFSEPDPPDSRPVIVHCSAGCGRTGTFCTVDSVIDMLKRQRSTRRRTRESSPMQIDRRGSARVEDSSPFFVGSAQTNDEDEGIEGTWLTNDSQDLIEKTVEDFRRQRLSMVQSLRQFVLCYESVMEWLVEQENED